MKKILFIALIVATGVVNAQSVVKVFEKNMITASVNERTDTLLVSVESNTEELVAGNLGNLAYSSLPSKQNVFMQKEAKPGIMQEGGLIKFRFQEMDTVYRIDIELVVEIVYANKIGNTIIYTCRIINGEDTNLLQNLGSLPQSGEAGFRGLSFTVYK